METDVLAEHKVGLEVAHCFLCPKDVANPKLVFSSILSTCFLFIEINPFPYIITLLGNKMAILDMDQNQVVWTFSAERDVGAVGYTADDKMGYYTQGDTLFLLNLSNHSSSEVFPPVTLLK